MKKILIVIPDLEIGGAQKSLTAFLKSLDASDLRDTYDIHLMVVKPSGAFLSQIPESVTLVQPPKELLWLGSPLSFSMFREHFSIRGVYGELCWLIQSRLKRYPGTWNLHQKMWACWKHLVPQNAQHYDVAVSYLDGYTNYYVMEKVTADRKILWIHNEYQKQNYDPQYDRAYYEAADVILTISEKCRQCIIREFAECAEKISVLENITSYETVIAQSQENVCREYTEIKGLKLLSVGRLSQIKGFDLAIEAAKLLRDEGVAFQWLVVGEGPERLALEEKIQENQLSDVFLLIGARENPYAYMNACDILVQPSRTEGRSIVLDEAKLLCKPIVVTNYTTVRDTVEHGKSGWIVEMTGKAIAEGILRLQQDTVLCGEIRGYLESLPKGNEEELKKYVQVMF